MSEESNQPSPIPKIRTFAADFKAHKNRPAEPIPKKDLPSKQEGGAPVSKTDVEQKPKTPIPIPKLNKKQPPVITPKQSEDELEKPKLPKSPIPAYHELQKKVDPIDSEHKTSHVKRVEPIKVGKPIIKKSSKKTHKKKPNLGYEATIITDTKKHNPDFFPTIIKSFSDWVQKILTPKEKAAPKYTVAESSTRKGVIQKATTKTGSIFTADNESLKEQIRKRRLEESAATKQKTDPAETSWSPYTETGYDLIESPDSHHDSNQSIPSVPIAENTSPKESEPSPIPQTPAKEIDFDEQRWSDHQEPFKSTPKTIEEKSLHQPDEGIAAHNSKAENNPAATEKPEVNETAPEIEVPTTNKKSDTDETADKEDDSQTSFSEKIDEVDTNTMSVLVLMIIIGVVSVILVGRLVYQYINTSLTDTQPQSTLVSPVLENSQITNLALTTNELTNLPELIDQTRLNSSEVILEIALTDTAGRELSPAYTLELLGFSMMPTMRQSINQVRFVSIDKKEEVIVLKFNNEENVRGGFLNWEKDLLNDLDDLYNLTDSNNAFSDRIIVDVDAREVMTNNGDSLTYTIVNGDTALISINNIDLERIINLEFKP